MPLALKEAATVATLDLAPEAHWITEYYPMEDVRPAQDGHLEADLVVADPRWLVRLVMRVSPAARIVAPAEFAELHRTTVARTLAQYDGPAGSAVR